MTPELIRALEQLAMHTDTMTAHRATLRELVQDARKRGASWESIGLMLGISKQAARSRFQPAPVRASAVPVAAALF